LNSPYSPLRLNTPLPVDADLVLPGKSRCHLSQVFSWLFRVYYLFCTERKTTIIVIKNYVKLTIILLKLSQQDFVINFMVVIVFQTVLFNQPAIDIVNHTVTIVKSIITIPHSGVPICSMWLCTGHNRA